MKAYFGRFLFCVNDLINNVFRVIDVTPKEDEIMTEAKIGCYVKIVEMKGEPNYKGKIGKVLLIDDAGQIHGTWGGCAIIPEEDRFEALSEDRNRLFEMCEKTSTSIDGMSTLVDYYIRSLGWSEKQACEYALGLFRNGTIQNIKITFGNGK